MKRFYCTVCKRVKRVRRIPPSVLTPNAEIVTERTGECAYHASGVRPRYKSERHTTAKPIKQVTIERVVNKTRKGNR